MGTTSLDAGAMPGNDTSETRKKLCSIEHANRVATQVAERTSTDTAVVKTSNPLQPYRVVLASHADQRHLVSRVLTCDAPIS